MWQIQARQQRSLGLDPDDLGEMERRHAFSDLITLLHEEATELSGVIPVHKRHILRMPPLRKSAITEEIADIFKTTIAIAQMYDVTPSEVYKAFMDKTEAVAQKAEQERLELQHNTRLLCFDLDDVICSLDPWRAELGIYDVRTLDAVDRLSAQEAMKAQFYEGGRFRYMAPVSGAPETLRKARELGYTIAIITARPQLQFKRIRSDTVAWLQNHRIPYDLLIFNRNKVEALHEHIAPAWPIFFVEDLEKNARALAAENVNVLLFTQPHNVGIELPSGIERVDSWDEISKRIE